MLENKKTISDEAKRLIAALPPERHEAETRKIGDDDGPTSKSFDAGWNAYRAKAIRWLSKC